MLAAYWPQFGVDGIFLGLLNLIAHAMAPISDSPVVIQTHFMPCRACGTTTPLLEEPELVLLFVLLCRIDYYTTMIFFFMCNTYVGWGW